MKTVLAVLFLTGIMVDKAIEESYLSPPGVDIMKLDDKCATKAYDDLLKHDENDQEYANSPLMKELNKAEDFATDADLSGMNVAVGLISHTPYYKSASMSLKHNRNALYMSSVLHSIKDQVTFEKMLCMPIGEWGTMSDYVKCAFYEYPHSCGTTKPTTGQHTSFSLKEHKD